VGLAGIGNCGILVGRCRIIDDMNRSLFAVSVVASLACGACFSGVPEGFDSERQVAESGFDGEWPPDAPVANPFHHLRKKDISSILIKHKSGAVVAVTNADEIATFYDEVRKIAFSQGMIVCSDGHLSDQYVLGADGVVLCHIAVTSAKGQILFRENEPKSRTEIYGVGQNSRLVDLVETLGRKHKKETDTESSSKTSTTNRISRRPGN